MNNPNDRIKEKAEACKSRFMQANPNVKAVDIVYLGNQFILKAGAYSDCLAERLPSTFENVRIFKMLNTQV